MECWGLGQSGLVQHLPLFPAASPYASLGFLTAWRPPHGQTSQVAAQASRERKQTLLVPTGWTEPALSPPLYSTGQSSKIQLLLPYHSKGPAIFRTDHIAVTLNVWLRECGRFLHRAAPPFLVLPFHTESCFFGRKSLPAPARARTGSSQLFSVTTGWGP